MIYDIYMIYGIYICMIGYDIYDMIRYDLIYMI